MSFWICLDQFWLVRIGLVCGKRRVGNVNLAKGMCPFRFGKIREEQRRVGNVNLAGAWIRYK